MKQVKLYAVYCFVNILMKVSLAISILPIIFILFFPSAWLFNSFIFLDKSLWFGLVWLGDGDGDGGDGDGDGEGGGNVDGGDGDGDGGRDIYLSFSCLFRDN